MKEIESWIIELKTDIETAIEEDDINMLKTLKWDLINHQNYLQNYINKMEELEEKISDVIRESGK